MIEELQRKIRSLRLEEQEQIVNHRSLRFSLDRYKISIPSSPYWLAGPLLVIAALALNLYNLGKPSLWFDEAFSAELARQPLPSLWHIIWGPEPNMELYYIFLHFWLRAVTFVGLQQTEFIVRFPSAVFAALSVFFVFLLGKRYLGRRVGLFVALLYLINYEVLIYAQQARSYALQLLLLCISWYALLHFCTEEKHGKRWLIVYAISAVLSMYAHLFSVFVLIAQWLAVAGLLILPGQWRALVRRRIPAFVASIFAIGVLVIPLLLVSRQGGRTSWLPVPHLGDIYQLFIAIVAGHSFYLYGLVFCSGVAVCLILLACGLEYLPALQKLIPRQIIMREQIPAMLQPRRYLPLLWMLLCWLVIPLIISYLVSQSSIHLFSVRYLVVITPAFLLCAGLGIASLRNWGVAILLACELIFLALPLVPAYYQNAQIEDWRTPSQWLIQMYRDGDGLVCYDNEQSQGCQVSVEYYLHTYASDNIHFTADSPGAFSWENDSSANPSAAVDPGALARYGARHPRIFFIVGRLPDNNAVRLAKQAQDWLNRHYQFVDQVVSSTVSIRLYITNKGEI